ncbi:MAG TPA: type II secretion system F family protein [Bryobacterales bacterium]|nr:type II secretion system F family protein [Bryobacterales bacterium]
MSLIILIVFIAVFAAVVLVSSALNTGATQEQKQILDRLDSISMAAQRAPEEEGLSLLRQEMLSSVPWINRWLQELDLFPRLRQLLREADVRWTVARLLLTAVASAVAVALGVYWRTGALPLAVMLGAGGATLPFLYVLYARNARFGAFEAHLPEALDLMTNALRAGHSLISALEMVSKEIPNPIADEFKKCFDEQNFGLELREAMFNLAARVPIHDMHIFVTAILIQKESGGNLAEILDKVAYVIRERFRIKRQIRVHTAQGRLTGWILTLLPPILGVLLYLINPEYMSRLWKSPTGMKLIYASLIMTTLGGLVIRKIVNIRV